MGLDIQAYSLLRHLPDACDDDADDGDDKRLRIWENPHFPGRAAGLFVGGVYSTADSRYLGFKAGSYSGYNHWRSLLEECAESLPAYAFHELIEFSDCEGTIGPAISAKLRDDFEQYRSAVQEKIAALISSEDERSYWLDRYESFAAAFALAAEDGCVVFC